MWADLFQAGGHWFLGLCAFGILLALLAIVVLGVLYAHDRYSERRKPRHAEPIRVRKVSGFTLTLLDRDGNDIASACIPDTGTPIEMTVKREGYLVRYALLCSGRVVREGNVVPAGRVGIARRVLADAENDLVLLRVSVAFNDLIQLRPLPPSWFPEVS